MKFDLHIQNIGKLTDAKIRIGRFTVFAGPNNTGKSFVSKIVYSLFNAMNANHAEIYINNLTVPLSKDIEDLQRHLGLENADGVLSSLQKEIDELHDMVVKSPIGKSNRLEKVIPHLVKKVRNMQTMFSDIRPYLEILVNDMIFSDMPNYEHKTRVVFNAHLHDVEQSLIELEKNIDSTSAMKFITSGIKHKIKENLIQNFQIPNLSDLRSTEEMSSQVDIKDFGMIEFSNEKLRFKIGRSLLRELQKFSSVIYVESPAYWKMKNALEDVRIRPRFMSRKRERLSGVPEYFYDLASALRSQYTGEMAFQDVYERLTGEAVLGGKIVISETGAFLFQENGRSFTMPVTAMGVANLGVLALLIERKVLDQETFLFIDEPEAHLHPAWQVIMAKALFDLAKGGANVVIATHSIDILKWLDVHIKKHPEDEKLVALNKFPVNGDEFAEHDFGYKMAAIKGELTEPFADLYLAGL